MHSMGALDIKFKLPNNSKTIRYELCLWTDIQRSQVTHSRSHWWPIIECRVDAGPQSGVPGSVFFPLCFVTHVQESQDSLFIWSALSSFTLENLNSFSQVLESYLLHLSFCLILFLQFWLWLHLCWVLQRTHYYFSESKDFSLFIISILGSYASPKTNLNGITDHFNFLTYFFSHFFCWVQTIYNLKLRRSLEILKVCIRNWRYPMYDFVKINLEMQSKRDGKGK